MIKYPCLATSNSKTITENKERVSSRQFDYQSSVEITEALETKNKGFTDELKNLRIDAGSKL